MERRLGEVPAGRAAPLAVLACLLAVTAAVLVLWAAVAGPGTVLEGEGRERVTLAEPTETTESAEAGSGEQEAPPEQEPREVPAWLRALVRAVLLVLEVAVAVTVGWVLWRAGRWAWQRWDARARRAAPAEELSGTEEVLDTESVARDLLSGEAQRRSRLEEGPPRNAVVACWREIEELAAASGVRRHPAETSTELARRLLDALGADEHAVSVLAQVYLRARYSEVQVSDADRSRALRALDHVHASVREGLRAAGGAR